MRRLTVCVLLLFVAAPPAAADEALPLWELGIGGGAFSLPQYMGSDERYTFPIAFPYLIYRGERWRLDRSGVRNRLLEEQRLSLDISLAAGLPVRNSNRARRGMPELFLTLELGPQVNWLLSETERQGWSLHLPLRAAVDIRGRYVGWLADPFIRYRYHRPLNGGLLRIRAEAGLLYGSNRYHDTYYTVQPLYATPARPVYEAGAGLHSAFAKLRLRYPLSRNWELFTSLQARTLAVGVVRDSPLVKSRTYTSVLAGAIWIFRTSEETVHGREE